MQVTCDGQPLELPEDIEGLLVINIPSYMGGVALWASSTGSRMAGHPPPQSFSDGLMEVRSCVAGNMIAVGCHSEGGAW